MTKWESPNDALKQLPPILFWDMGRTGDFAPTTTTNHSSPLVKADRVPLAGITECTTFPTKNIQVQAQVSS